MLNRRLTNVANSDRIHNEGLFLEREACPERLYLDKVVIYGNLPDDGAAFVSHDVDDLVYDGGHHIGKRRIAQQGMDELRHTARLHKGVFS